eukprot:TRINITY_DN3877_c0_g1_i4.p1 TRINITY_DN3877_c0_g1~~TRINITY_DN3877_c0_g1_i4.p1  ORF type:complete len:616 (-),score=79.31 TRINITY_DN3877_c0_g1_i4:118-1932(-)
MADNDSTNWVEVLTRRKLINPHHHQAKKNAAAGAAGGGISSSSSSSAEGGDRELARVLTAFDLIVYGVSCTIGAGIFVLTGVAAKNRAGPSLILSFVFDVISCLFSALCYSEFAARIPLAGSAYSYAYVAMGEFVAWMTGLSLLESYIFSASAVARGWSGYVQMLALGAHVDIPKWLSGYDIGFLEFDLLAALLIILISVVAIFGMRASAWLNNIVTGLSIIVIFGVIFGGIPFIESKNWTDDFFPFGFNGIFMGAATMYFAFIGFDSIANLSEEVKNPNRDVPIGILASLVICSVLYMGVSLVVTGMVPYHSMDLNAPISEAFARHGVEWANIVISVGAFAALTTTELVLLSSIPRVLLSMGRDGLVPAWFSRVSTTKHTPINSIVFCSLLAAILSLLAEVEFLAEVTSIGILVPFTLVCYGVVVQRHQSIAVLAEYNDDILLSENPNRTRRLLLLFMGGVSIFSVVQVHLSKPFEGSFWWLFLPCAIFWIVPAFLLYYDPVGGRAVRYPTIHPQFYFADDSATPGDGISTNAFACPFVPTIPLLGIFVNIYMIANLQWSSYVCFIAWLLIGTSIYFAYGFKNSVLNNASEERQPLVTVQKEI